MFENGVCVPTYFYKTILIFNDSIKQSIGFIFPHERCEGELFEYAVSVDSIESITDYQNYDWAATRGAGFLIL